MDKSDHHLGALHGARIWLSGSIPTDITGQQKNAMTAFVEQFADMIFRNGGHILHGSHPTLVEVLLRVAKKHSYIQERRDCLTLAVSNHWSKNKTDLPLDEWRKFALVYETPEANTKLPETDSLAILREWMAERCDAFVSLGGDLWKDNVFTSGIPIEVGLAIKRGLPSFILGGLGGAAERLLARNGELLRSLKNGLDQDTNLALAQSENVDSLVETVYTQLTRLPLVHGRVSDGVSFRILALDGGGVKGAFTAAVLAQLEEDLGSPIGDHFDLIAGTSTGGILALGLGLGIPPKQILEFYRQKGPKIFPMTNVFGRMGRSLRRFFWAPKFDGEILIKSLTEAYFPNGGAHLTLKDSKCRLVIPAYYALGGLCHTFRTPHHDLLTSDGNTNIAEVARATAAAPTYFSAGKVKEGVATSSYFDGGVWANCPVMAGIIEATTYLDVPLNRIDVLSIGTTSEPFNASIFEDSSAAGWNKNIITLLMNAQVNAAVDHAQSLIGRARFLRIDVPTSKDQFSLDDSRKIEELASLGAATAKNVETKSQIRSRFLNRITVRDWKLP